MCVVQTRKGEASDYRMHAKNSEVQHPDSI